MYLLHLIIFPVRLVLYVLRLAFFRVYMLLIFFAKAAAPVLIVAAVIAGLYFSWEISAPIMLVELEAAIQPFGGLRRAMQPVWEFRLAAALTVGLIALYVVLSWVQRLLSFILPAFPFPRRPVWPRLPLRARKHRIERVDCRIAVTKMLPPLFSFFGDRRTYGLQPELLQLLDGTAQSVSAASMPLGLPPGTPASSPAPSRTVQRPAMAPPPKTAAKRPCGKPRPTTMPAPPPLPNAP